MRLLIPLDRSPRDGLIVPYAMRLARRLRARLVIVHFVPVIRALLPGSLREAEAYVDAVAQSVREDGLKAEAVFGRGDPAPQILRLATDLPADIIVMATRARHGVGKLMFGSVADAIIALSPVPVVLVREQVNQTVPLTEDFKAIRRAA